MPQQPIPPAKTASPIAVAVMLFALSFARGLVLVMVMALPMVMLKRLGESNSWAAFGTALLLLPFVLRGWMRPLAAMLSCRWWAVVVLQALLAAAVWGVASHPDAGNGLWCWLSIFALAGALHDVIASGLTVRWGGAWHNHRRVLLCLVGAVLAAVVGMGITMVLAGDLEVLSRQLDEAWQTALMLMVALLAVTALICAWVLPKTENRDSLGEWREAWQVNNEALAGWWAMRQHRLLALMTVALSLHQWMLWRATLLFLIDPGSIGGLSLGPQGVGFALGTVGGLALIAGLVMGVGAVGRDGLEKWLWPMTLSLTLPDVLLLYLSYEMPSDLLMVSGCLLGENLLAGFGMAGMLYYLLDDAREDAGGVHADCCMAWLALSALVAGVGTGFMLDRIGYRRFFFLVVVAALMAVATMAWHTKKRQGDSPARGE